MVATGRAIENLNWPRHWKLSSSLFLLAASSCDTASSTSSIGNSGSAEEAGHLAIFSFIVPTGRTSEQHSLRATLATSSYFRDGLLLNSKEKCGKLVQVVEPPSPQRIVWTISYQSLLQCRSFRFPAGGCNNMVNARMCEVGVKNAKPYGRMRRSSFTENQGLRERIWAPVKKFFWAPK